jgi:SAM-dependent methyltransferase
MGNPCRYAGEKPEAVTPAASPRDWENWHCWGQDRIERIVVDERKKPESVSARWRLAQIVMSLGETLLDVGCGPGAMWTHFEPHRGRFSWTGLDTTQQMLDVAHQQFPDVPVFCGDSGSLPFENDQFDVVLLRHVLEHQPPWLMERSLAQALRVAKRAVVVDFYVPPSRGDQRFTHRVGENFLETQWTEADLKAPISNAGWQVQARFNITPAMEDRDEIWVLAPTELSAAETVQQDPGPKVSIVMPTYRRCHTVLRTIRTIWAQTYKNWELILVDNSGDGEYQFADPRIRCFQYSERTSASYARNQGLLHATGELVCFFDDDDDMFPNYLERFVAAFKANPRAKMVRCGMLRPNGRTDYSHATPECCLRREYATSTWDNHSYLQDQHYFSRILAANRWSEQKGDILIVREALCRANGDMSGGLRDGQL